MMHIPHKELRPAIKRYADGATAPAWDLYLDGALIASEYTSQIEALLELDLAAWYALCGDAALAPTIPITDEAIGLAMQVFNRLFGDGKVQEKARIARDKIIAAGIYTIDADGGLSVLASSGRGKASYAVTAQRTSRADDADAGGARPPAYRVTMTCECRDFYARAHAHAGICKHVAARMLLHLAQRGVGPLKHMRDALDAAPIVPIAMETAPPDTPAMAFLSLGAADLAAACFLVARAETPIAFHAEQGRLRLVAGSIDVSYPCADGCETAAVRIAPDAFKALYDALRAIAPKLATVTVFVTPGDGSVVVTDNLAFSACVQGESIPGASPTPEPTAPVADTGTVDALYELFTLLETHEPAWYLKRHYRMAHTALHEVGRVA